MERNEFEQAIEREVVRSTDDLLYAIDRIAERMGVSAAETEAAINRFAGGDLADCWVNYLAEAAS